MKLNTQLKLLPTPEQAATLRHTVETVNAAYDYISTVVRTFGKYALQKRCYQDVRCARHGFRHAAARLGDRLVCRARDKPRGLSRGFMT